MSLSAGTRLGHYDVTALIGEGGMGQVYQATDTQLNREVALKILPDAFADDPDRLARFQREAQVLASLNHPGIAAIYGIEKSDDNQALVLELVAGPTLADRIAKGPIPVDEALPIAKQIAEALEAAHEAGVIHRDLKPANVKVKDDGTVKVLDFGLAKGFQAETGDPNRSQSPTVSLTAAATQMGMVIGTAAYMAPEQAKGNPVDKRADVWAFGVVLYEMLTGRKPFSGDDISTTLARVIEREPDWDVIPDTLPPVLGTYMRRCLAKNPKQRIHDIADVRLALEGAFGTTVVVTAGSATVAPPLRPWQRPVPRVLAALLVAATTGLAIVWNLDLTQGRPQAFARLSVTPPATAPLGASPTSPDLTISPDGTQIVYRGPTPGTGEVQLYRRTLDRFESIPLQGTQGAEAPSISGDGEWVLFTVSRTLRRISLLGGGAVTLAASPHSIRGAVWAGDDQVVFGTVGAGLFGIPPGGGEPEIVTTLDGAAGETGHYWPHVLPGGRAVLFTVASGQPRTTGRLAVVALDTGRVTDLGVSGVSPRYASTGHLIYATENGSLHAAPFDAAGLVLTGTPVPVLNDVVVSNNGATNFDC